MSEYVVSCSSTVDMTEEFMKARNLPFAMFHFNLNGKDYPDDLGKSIPFDKFYKMIEDGAMPTTSQVDTEQYVELFESILKEGKDILHLAMSSGISGTYNSAMVAQGIVQEKYPERKIIVLDSLAASGGFGLLVTLADDNRLAGMSIEDNAKWVMDNRLHVHHWFFSTDLTSYWRGGRVSRFSAVVGGVLNICPLLNVNSEGKLIPRDRVRGKKKVMHEIVQRMAEHAQGGTDYTGKAYTTHSACYDDARAVADEIEARFPNLAEPVSIYDVGATIGCHLGPGAVVVNFWGDRRLDNAPRAAGKPKRK